MPSLFQFQPLRGTFVIALAALFLQGCASKPVESFRDGTPVFKPEEFFAGSTQSWGVFETKSGAPKEVLHTKTTGRWDGNCLHFEQDLLFEDGKRKHRSWLIRRLGEGHYSATGTGIVGTAQGEARGNVFHLEFTLDAMPGNPLGHVHMSQWMYLQPDGVSMVNRDTISKAGIIITEITELFRKSR